MYLNYSPLHALVSPRLDNCIIVTAPRKLCIAVAI
jgi:hypothetical protein